jgi:hypothetical protein
MACAKRLTVVKCGSRDQKEYYAISFIDGRTPDQWALGTTIKFGYDRATTYNTTNGFRKNQKWIVKDVGTCESSYYTPAPYLQHAPAQTVSPCNSRGTFMARKGGGLSDNRMSRYRSLKG